MSDLIERYKVLTARLTQLEAESAKIKGERELICGQLLAADGKGHAYDLGDGMPVVVAMTKIGTHYMAPKNKWRKAGRPPKPPKQPRAPKAAKETKPAVRRAIVDGKIVEIPIPGSTPPPPERVEPERVAPVKAAKKAQSSAPPPVSKVVEKPAERPMDDLEAALAALDASDIEVG